MWSYIIDREFLSNTSVHPSTPTSAIFIVRTMAIPIVPTTTIPNVLLKLEHGVHENVVAKPNMDDDVQDDGNRMDVNNVQLSASHIHPLPNNVPPPMLPTPSRQPIKTRPPIPVPHGEGTPNIVAHPSPLQGRPSYPVGG